MQGTKRVILAILIIFTVVGCYPNTNMANNKQKEFMIFYHSFDVDTYIPVYYRFDRGGSDMRVISIC